MSTLSKKLADNGYVTFDGHSFGDSSKEIATNIGTVINVPGAQIVQELRPDNKVSLEASSYSGNYGLEEFPFHSDMAHWFRPPRFLLLCCRTPALSVETRVVKSERIFEGEDIHDLRRALFRPRRRLSGRLSHLRLFEGEFYRWDSLFIQPINKLAICLRSRIIERLANVSYQSVVLGNYNQCLLIDNWRAFHSRSAVTAEGMNRRVERIYLAEVKG
ncbi:hypothetical protein [Vreelandella stevensii]|uniref:hypothetical protein n=1 Tax=Vreelandella stevensii TaxID=502821 RepID=UPI00403B2045